MVMLARRLVIVCLAASVSPAFSAEPEALSTATHVVSGKVTGVFRRDEDLKNVTFTTYVFEVTIDKVEKGEGPAPGSVVYLRRAVISKVINPAAKVPGWIGLSQIPKAGDPVRAYYRREANGRCEVVLNPDAIELLKK
jgi:hypothetical protein